jgi:hypothetical protein
LKYPLNSFEEAKKLVEKYKNRRYLPKKNDEEEILNLQRELMEKDN